MDEGDQGAAGGASAGLGPEASDAGSVRGGGSGDASDRASGNPHSGDEAAPASATSPVPPAPFQDGSQLAWPTAGVAARVRAGGKWRYFYLDARRPTDVRAGWWGDASRFYTSAELAAAPTLGSAPFSVGVEGGAVVRVDASALGWLERRLAEWLATARPPIVWPPPRGASGSRR